MQLKHSEDISYFQFLIASLYWRNYSLSNQSYIDLLKKLVDLQDPERLMKESSITHKCKRSGKLKIKPWPKSWWKMAELEWAYIKKNNIQWAAPGLKNYPSQLLPYDWCPKLITWKGPCLWQKPENNLAIVGSRRPMGAVYEWLDSEFVKFYEANPKLVIVSGGARGVDQKAHAIALRSGRQTMCFLPTGLQNPYPSEINRLEKFYARTNSSIVSLFSPFEEIYKSHFYLRNRLIVGLSKSVLVASAALRSGSMMTAKHAMEMGKDVLALPGFPMSENMDGNLQLIYDGALMVRSADDLKTYWS